MARSLNVNAIAEVAKKFGTEPVNIVGVFWDGITELQYADKEILNIPGKIISLGSLDEIIKVENRNTNASVEVTLDDTEGDLKYIIDHYDIHKKKCILYQYFNGLDINDSFVVLTGEINTPIVWNEGERTLTFTIISVIESVEVGFAPEEGQFANVDPAFVGKVWPLAFGEVVHVPATKVIEKLRGVTQTLIGIPDYTLPFKYWHLIERRDILVDGYKYYCRAIQFLLTIARKPDDIITDYVATILDEDPIKQHNEDLSIFITENEKFIDKLNKMLDNARIAPQVITYCKLSEVLPNQGQQQPIKSYVAYVTFNVRTRADIKEIISDLTELIKSDNTEREYTTILLEDIEKIKNLLEIESDNAEYSYKTIHSIGKKIQTLLIEYVKTIHDIVKLITVMEQHALIPTTAVSILNGYKFPQNQLVRIAINGLTYSGVFTGNLFSVLAFEPRYENIRIAQREDDEIDAFWIEDENINLKGHYCLTVGIIGPGDPEYILQQSGYDISSIQNRLFKVTDQIGRKCILELVEISTSQRVERQQPKMPVLEDLPQEIWDALQYASEHTEQQKQRILENALSKYDKAELERIKKILDLLKEIALQARTRDQAAAVNEVIFKNLNEYNARVSELKFTKDTVEKVAELINKQEFNTLLKLCNLRLQRIDQEFFDETEVPVTKIYYLTGYDIKNIVASSPVMLPSWFQYASSGSELVTNKTVVPLPNGTQVIADFLPESTLWTAEPGSEVVLVSSEAEKYVANWLPSTIYAVYGFKAINGIRQLIPIPKAYYAKNENDTSYLPLHCTTITLKKPLKDYADEDWEDGVYVSMASSIGPNTVDIIQWIIEQHTNLTCDPTTFAHVSSRLANYPSSFALFDKKDALQLVEEIAWQARCVSWIKNGIIYLKYLSEEPDSVATITETDIDYSSLSLEYTPTEELITKFVAKWQSNYAYKDKFNQVILRYNLVKYSEIKNKDYDFFIYNIEELVYKSATYWLIRLSNIWKLAKFKTPLTQLVIETLDCIIINTAIPYYANSATKALVNKATYDSQSNTIDFECWLPVRAGEMDPYIFAWPADLEVDVLYPTIAEINNGFAGSPHNPVPLNLSYKIKPNISLVEQLQLRPKDYGDAFPSDGANFYPSTPLAGLSEADYLTMKPKNFKIRDEPRFAEVGRKPEFDTPIKPPVIIRPPYRDPWVGRVSKVIDSDEGRYEVKSSNGYKYEVVQFTDGAALKVNQPITVFYDDGRNQYVTHTAQDPNVKLFPYVMLEELNDYMYCVPFNYADTPPTLHSATLGADVDPIVKIKIAKPRLLQKTPFDGKTVVYPTLTVSYMYTDIGVRIASSPGKDNETQIITPPYFVGDIIIARPGPTGYENVEYTDVNEGGREWALIVS